jgi:yecA family protein
MGNFEMKPEMKPAFEMKALAGIDAKEFTRRRKQLMRIAGDDAILILPAALERIRSRDTHYPYRQDSDFWYLTGFPEPDAVIVLVPGRAHGETILFCRERDPEREGWDGPRSGPEGAVERFGMDDAYPIDDLDEILPGLLEGRTRVYYHFGRDAEFDLKLIGWLNRVRAQVRMGAQPPHEFLELGHLLDELRLFKSPAEVDTALHALGLAMDAAELHGALAGWLAGGGAQSPDWLAQVLADNEVPQVEAGGALDRLRQATAAQLDDRSFGFDLLLPGTEASLGERSGALFDWCRGFLGGFGLAVGKAPPLSEEGSEALTDLARLAAAVPQDDGDEDDEEALVEIEEFVRVAALLIHGDCVLAVRHRQQFN